jgi:alanyl-tRNA synthetase
LLGKVTTQNDHQVLVAQVQVPTAEALKQLAYELKAQVSRMFCVLGAEVAGKPQLAVMISEELMAEKQLHAGNIVKELARDIKGGGGGQPFFATAGGSDASGLAKALERAKTLLG